MNRGIPSNVVAFAGDKIDLYTQFKDYFNHYHDKNGSRKSMYNEYNTQGKLVTLSEKEDKINEGIKSEIARLSNLPDLNGIAPEALAAHPAYAWATFAVIGALVDVILPDALIDSIGLYTDVRVGGFGDSFAFDVKARDLFVVSKGSKGKRHGEVHKQFEGQVTIVPEFRDITVQVSLYKVLAGKENMAEFAMKAAKSLEAQMAKDAFTAFNTAMGALDNAGDDALRFSGYSQSTLVELAQKVTAWNGGNKAVIAGTQLAVQNILPADANYRYDLESDYVKLGYIQTAFNYDVMIIPQVADYTTPFKLALDDTKLYILSPSANKIMKMCLEGSTISITDGIYQNANLTQNTTMKKAYGIGVCTNSLAGVIELS